VLGRPLDRGDIDRARKLVRSQSAVDSALDTAGDHVTEAVTALGALAPCPAVGHLAAAATALLTALPPG